MINYSFQINNIITSSDDPIRPDDISGAHVYITAIDQDKTYASLTAWIPFSKTENFIDFTDVTPEMINDWILTDSTALSIIEEYKVTLDEMIANIKNPPPPIEDPLIVPEPLVIEENGVLTVVNPVSTEFIIDDALMKIMNLTLNKITAELKRIDRAQFLTYMTTLIDQAQIKNSDKSEFTNGTKLILDRVDATVDTVVNNSIERQDVVNALNYLTTGTITNTLQTF